MSSVALPPEAETTLVRIVDAAHRIHPDPTRVQFAFIKDLNADTGRLYITGVKDVDGQVHKFVEPIPA